MQRLRGKKGQGLGVRVATRRARPRAGEALEAVSGELSFFTLPNCFELFGFDLLVDDAWHVWLLEARSRCW